MKNSPYFSIANRLNSIELNLNNPLSSRQGVI